MQVELVFFTGCPHAAAARERLRTALARLGMPLEWKEWDTASGAAPDRVLGFSSPSVLVDGIDVDGKVQGSGAGCAVGSGPGVEAIVGALRSAPQ